MKFKHLEESQESYVSHCKWAVSAGLLMIWGGILSVIHGVLPSVFPFKSAKIIVDLYYKRLHNHKNKNYRDYINKVSNQIK
jgi:hypothetical protein